MPWTTSSSPGNLEIEARTAVMATGFALTPIHQKKEYGQGRVPNVITSLQMERLLAPHGPYQRVLRPSDGKEPESIAYIQCAGSRDKSLGISYCSRVCCMYAIKQAMLISGALPLADVTIYYMDIRAFGKGYEQFFQNAKAMGIEFVKGKIAAIARVGRPECGPALRGPGRRRAPGHKGPRPGGAQPRHGPRLAARRRICDLSTDGDDAFIRCAMPQIAPTRTDLEGVFVAGVAAGPKDIVDTITEAGAAAMEAANYLGKPSSTQAA